MTASLAYRKNEAQILNGIVPEKYLRILPHVPGSRIIEFGSAEGVLALLLAKEGRLVIAVEKNRERHEAAERLQKQWGFTGNLFHANRTAIEALPLVEGMDTLVAVRMIYYLKDDLDTVFAEVARKVPNVVLCGNRNRADRYRAGIIDPTSNADDYYASREGMRDVLERHGYVVIEEVTEGDEIVVGRRHG